MGEQWFVLDSFFSACAFSLTQESGLISCSVHFPVSICASSPFSFISSPCVLFAIAASPLLKCSNAIMNASNVEGPMRKWVCPLSSTYRGTNARKEEEGKSEGEEEEEEDEEEDEEEAVEAEGEEEAFDDDEEADNDKFCIFGKECPEAGSWSAGHGRASVPEQKSMSGQSGEKALCLRPLLLTISSSVNESRSLPSSSSLQDAPFLRLSSLLNTIFSSVSPFFVGESKPSPPLSPPLSPLLGVIRLPLLLFAPRSVSE